MEIHATVIDNILTQNFLTKPNWSTTYDQLAIVILGALIGIALPRMSALKGLFLAAGLFTLHIFIARWLFVNLNVWLNIVYPLLVLAITYTVLTVYHYVTEERERKKIKGAFQHYVAPIVIEEMLKDPERLQLGGEEKVLTVLFSDLAGFTGYSERFSPHEMISMLSEYFEKMTEHIFAQQGTLKEYVGDELMAIFGAPLEQADHAQRACAAALAMRDRLQALRSEWAKVGRPPFDSPNRGELGPHADRQPWIPISFCLRSPGGPGEPRLPTGGTQQDLWHRDPARGEHGRPVGGVLSVARGRPGESEGQEAARSHLRALG